MFYWVGFNQIGMDITRQKKREKSNYSLKRKISLFINAVTSFSSYPLYLLFWTGTFMFLITSLVILFLIFRKIFFPETILIGYTSITVLLLHIEGLIILVVSILGLYIAKLFNQSLERPRYIIKDIH
jgi:putative glycosyltransferase